MDMFNVCNGYAMYQNVPTNNLRQADFIMLRLSKMHYLRPYKMQLSRIYKNKHFRIKPSAKSLVVLAIYLSISKTSCHFDRNNFLSSYVIMHKFHMSVMSLQSIRLLQKIFWDKFISLCMHYIITKTYLYNFDPLIPHFYIVKLGFTGVYIIFLISAQNIDNGYSLEPPRRGTHNLCFEQK